MKTLLFAVALTLTGCADAATAFFTISSDPVYFKHPQTGIKAQCGPYYASGLVFYRRAQRQTANCATRLEEKGYKLVK